MSRPSDASKATGPPPAPSGLQNSLYLPPRWLQMYDDFITKNAHQVSQIESALRSLTYIIPGRFRDAEIASESIHSGVQLLSLYHDTLLLRALTYSKLPAASLAQIPSPHNRYTRHWTEKNSLYRRVAYLLQIVSYTELLCEMAAKRKGERTRWRVVVLLEAIKAICRLLLMHITRSRPLVSPVLPERERIPEDAGEGQDEDTELEELERLETETQNGKSAGGANGHANVSAVASKPRRIESASVDKDWNMPRTGMSLPNLPAPGDIGNYLLSRVLTADDIKPATKLVNQLHGSAQAAEILHILAPLIYAIALARSRNRRSWTPWLLGLSAELMARQLRDRSLRTTPLEREEWGRRGWAMGWWAMRGAFYENVMKGVVGGVKRRVPSLVGGILEDYEYLWENYYFSTSG